MAKAVLTFALYQGDALQRRETVTQDIVKVGKDPKSLARFVSEKQLAGGRVGLPPLRLLVVPKATHVSESAAKRFVGPMIFVGDDCMKWDEYHRPRNPIPRRYRYPRSD